MRADQRESFEEFAISSGPRLLRTAWYLAGDPTRAEDLVQETLTRLYVVWPRISRNGGDPGGYAHRVLVNLHTDEWRRRRREEVAADPPDRPARTVAAEHVDIVRALAGLGARERQVVVLRHLADLPERTVADLLGISVGAVKSSGSDGLRKLRVALGDGHVTA
ncbi:MAG: SigE family RNA polymerase sigma factor [Austwickia sp.]|nr:SigE family RNA polymerase sigma factor [Austwickia sp.]MCO5310057.1 SigE family RNA polymerase sigma factor [Austwickia sp.]